MAIDVSNILYPGDPLRKQKSHNLSQSVHLALVCNFHAINHLSEFLRRELKLDPVDSDLMELTMIDSETVKYNCKLLVKRTKILHNIVGKLDKFFQERLESHLYTKLIAAIPDFSSTIAVADRVRGMLRDLPISSGCVAVVAIVNHRKMLERILTALKRMESSLMAETVLSSILEFM